MSKSLEPPSFINDSKSFETYEKDLKRWSMLTLIDGRKNWTDREGKVAKCFKCACEHKDDCDCPCTFHLASQCPNKRITSKDINADLSLFTRVNGPTLFMTDKDDSSEEEIVLLIKNEKMTDTFLVETSMEELCLTIQEVNNVALIDSACPTTVAGLQWVNSFVARMSKDNKKKLKTESSN